MKLDQNPLAARRPSIFQKRTATRWSLRGSLGPLIAVTCVLSTCVAEAKSLYVAKSGSDGGNDCTSQAGPCATIGHGIASMAAGDTLVIGDGVYAEQIIHMPNGTAAAYTTIQAANDWGVTIDGSGFANNYLDGIRVGYGSYVAIRGFHVKMNQSNDENIGVDIYGSNHVKVQRCSVAYSGTIGNVSAFGVGPANDYVLVEESYVYGGARYPFLVYQSTHTVMRRNVSRLDYWNGSLQAANFTNYNGDNTVWENNIAIDSDNATIGGAGLFGGFFNENKVPDSSWSGTATRETHRGNIVLNVQAFYSGIYDYDVSNLHTYSDDIVWDSHGGYYGDYIHGDAPVLNATRLTIGKIRGTYLSADGQGSAGTGFYIGPGTGGTSVSNTLTNSILWNNPSYGVADYAVSDYNSFWSDVTANYGGTYATPAAGAHDHIASMDGLKYLPRVEPGSALATAGSDGGQVGADVQYMWGTTGTLWGDAGYDTITANQLWPFPNEAVIKADMASYSGPGGAGARGFTNGNSLDGTPQTLTKYVWEYLGNQIPAAIYGFHIATGSLPQGTVGVAYQADVTAAGGTAPYGWAMNSGALPAGLSLDSSTGRISGTPSAAGTSTLTLGANDASTPAQTATMSLQLVIVDAATTGQPSPDGGSAAASPDGGSGSTSPNGADGGIAAASPDGASANGEGGGAPANQVGAVVHSGCSFAAVAGPDSRSGLIAMATCLAMLGLLVRRRRLTQTAQPMRRMRATSMG